MPKFKKNTSAFKMKSPLKSYKDKARSRDIKKGFEVTGNGPYVPYKPGTSAYNEYRRQGIIPEGPTGFDSSTGRYYSR